MTFTAAFAAQWGASSAASLAFTLHLAWWVIPLILLAVCVAFYTRGTT